MLLTLAFFLLKKYRLKVQLAIFQSQGILSETSHLKIFHTTQTIGA